MVLHSVPKAKEAAQEEKGENWQQRSLALRKLTFRANFYL